MHHLLALVGIIGLASVVQGDRAIPTRVPGPLYAVELSGDTVEFLDREHAAYVLAGNYACSQCYRDVEEALRSYDSLLEIVCIIRPSDNTASARRRAFTRQKRLIDADRYLFDRSSPMLDQLGAFEDGILGSLGVSITPSVLLRGQGGVWFHLPYSLLFPGQGSANAKGHMRAILERVLEGRQ